MKKQNKTAVKPKSLSSRKTARDAESHLDFSITKKVIHADNYEALVRKRAYAHRKADALAHLSGKNERVQTARAELAGTESRGAQTHLLPVHVGALPRSPHVVRLLGEWERTALSAIEPKKGGAASASRGASPDAGERWQREVARLRSQTAHTKHVARGITIDLLGKPSRGAKKRKKREKFAFSSLPAKAGSGLKKAAFASLRWLFEFVLSIPLGFLLGFTVLLTLIEASNRLSVRGARSLGAGVSWLIQHVFFVIIAAVKAILVIPVKLVTFACMAAYRAVASGGLLALVAATALWEGAKNYVSVFTRPPKHLYRKLAVLTAIGIVVMLPVKFLETAPDQIRLLKGSVLGATKDGYQGLASLDLESAQASFASARSAIESLNLVMAVAVSVLPAGQDGLHAITAGDELAEAARYLADAVAPPHGAGGEAGGLALLSRIQESLTASLPHLALAAENISAIDPRNIPPEFSEKFRAARDLLPRVAGAVQDGSELFAILADVLGANGDRRYVVLFQNNNELRPAGGFIGSLAFVDVRGGKVTNIEVPGGGAYDFQGYLSEHVLAPKPLSLINARWELQDANWYPDWRTSAEKVIWFLEHAGYSSVDGVIAVQATTLEKLLEVTGPVDFPEYGVTLDSKNVLNEIQTAVEVTYALAENKPKQYIAELVPRVLEKLLAMDGSKTLDALFLVKSEISEKNILLYFADQEANQAFAARGWQPSIAAAAADYLSVIHANIGGGKTDGVISESWDQEVVIDGDGVVAVELTIIREHQGDPQNQFENYNNVDYARIYAPQGSELISFEGAKPPAASLFQAGEVYLEEDAELASIEGKAIIDEATGTRITNEFGKTVFGNWLQVNPGNVLVAKVAYQLPFKIKPYDFLNPSTRTGYSLIMQKQPGARAIPYSVSLRYPSEWSVSWSKVVGDGAVNVLGPGLTVFEGSLSSDTGFAVSFED